MDKLTDASIDPFETLKADIAKAQLTQVRSPTGGSLPPSLGVYHTMLRVQNRPELTHLGCVFVSQADVEAWEKVQPPPKEKGKPTPEYLAASKVTHPCLLVSAPIPTRDAAPLPHTCPWLSDRGVRSCPGGVGRAGSAVEEAGRK